MFPEVLESLREVQLPLLAVLLFLGAVAKAMPGAESTGLATLVPQGWRRPVTLATCVLEVVASVALLTITGPLGDVARLLTALLFSASLVVLSVVRRRDPEAGCGCFGGLSREPIGWRTLTRAFLLAVAAAATVGLAPTGWTVVSGPTSIHGAVLGAELLLLAWLSPEPREVLTRASRTEPCALREVSSRRTLRRLRRSDVWRDDAGVMLDGEPEDTWRHGCWRFLRYGGTRHGRPVDVVYAVRLDGPPRTAVRAVLVDRESGTVVAATDTPPPTSRGRHEGRSEAVLSRASVPGVRWRPR